MQNAIFVQSVWIGLSIAAPVGPIGLLVIQRTLQHGAGLGLATGLGAAAADAVFGALGAFGVSAVIGLLQSARVPLALLGGAFLLWLAWRNWVAQPASARAQMAGAPRLWPSFVGTFLLTLANPRHHLVLHRHLCRLGQPWHASVAGRDGAGRAARFGFVVAAVVRDGERIAQPL
jgi:threonine/homoserine/homoserine lactone efflux protein